MQLLKRFRLDVVIVGFLSTFIFLIWCFINRRLSIEAWNTPITYSWDDWQTLTNIAVYWKNEAIPILSKNIPHLNAPFSANWDDWPFGEDLIFFLTAQVAKLTNLFFAANLCLLFAHLSAGISFYISARFLKLDRTYALLGAALYGLSNFAFTRSLQHIVITYYWHVPLLTVLVWWLFKKTFDELKKWQIVFAYTLVFLSGFFFIYYTFLFFQFFFFAFLYHWIRKNKKMGLFILSLSVVYSLTTILMQLDTFFYQWKNGPNKTILSRSLIDVEFYALKLPDLFLPITHRLAFLENFSHKVYFDQVLAITGERGYPYIGLVGVLGFIYIFTSLFLSVLKNQSQKIHLFTWLTIWTILFSIVGGVNLLISSITGFNAFRCTNRYSIVILTFVLFLFFRFLQTQFRFRKVFLCLIFILLLVDLPKRVSQDKYGIVYNQINSDRLLTQQMEAHSPGQTAMVFQLPVSEYPAHPAIFKMQDYEHFRPYLFSHNLHFSYGGAKGRPREQWQIKVAALPIQELIAQLKVMGFKMLYINRRGYEDDAKKLELDLRGLGYRPIVQSLLNDIVVYQI